MYLGEPTATPTPVGDADPAGDCDIALGYDTQHVGNSAAGHPFPDDNLDDAEKLAVMEYLKTL